MTLCFVECHTFNFKRALQEDSTDRAPKTKIPRWKGPSSPKKDETVAPAANADEKDSSKSSSLAIIVFVIGSVSALVLWFLYVRSITKKLKEIAENPKLETKSSVASENVLLESIRKTEYRKSLSSDFIQKTSQFSGVSTVTSNSDAPEMIFLDSFRKTEYSNSLSSIDCIPMKIRFSETSSASCAPRFESRADLHSTTYSIIMDSSYSIE